LSYEAKEKRKEKNFQKVDAWPMRKECGVVIAIDTDEMRESGCVAEPRLITASRNGEKDSGWRTTWCR